MATSRAHAHAAAAEAELAARRAARAAEPLAHLDTDALERQVRAAGRMLATTCRVTARCDERRAAAGRDVTEAGAELEALAGRPATAAAQAMVSAEQLEAARADELAAERGAELEVALGHRCLGIHVVRGHQRSGLTSKLGALAARRAAAPSDTASCDVRRARLLADGAAADDAALVRATGRLARAPPPGPPGASRGHRRPGHRERAAGQRLAPRRRARPARRRRPGPRPRGAGLGPGAHRRGGRGGDGQARCPPAAQPPPPRRSACGGARALRGAGPYAIAASPRLGDWAEWAQWTPPGREKAGLRGEAVAVGCSRRC